MCRGDVAAAGISGFPYGSAYANFTQTPVSRVSACVGYNEERKQRPTLPIETSTVNYGDAQAENNEILIDSLTRVMDADSERNTEVVEMPSWTEEISVFFSMEKPEIETRVYMQRLVQYAMCSPSAFYVALVYLKRLGHLNSKLKITAYNMHRLLITALTLAIKMLEDRCYSNAHYARVGGIASVQEMNRLELCMLSLLDFRLNVSFGEYEEFVERVNRASAPSSPTTIQRIEEVYPCYVACPEPERWPNSFEDDSRNPPGVVAACTRQDEVCEKTTYVYQFEPQGHGYPAMPMVYTHAPLGHLGEYRCSMAVFGLPCQTET